jgi:hypothetical protein
MFLAIFLQKVGKKITPAAFMGASHLKTIQLKHGKLYFFVKEIIKDEK